MNIEVKNISKRYGKKQILRNISFEVPEGTAVGIAGTNGSGKSTLLGVLAGTIKADSGSLIYNGSNILGNAGSLSPAVGYVPQGTPLFEELSAKDNLLLWYTSAQLKYELANGVLAMLGIREFLNKRVSKMSGGMKKRLSIGCSMAGHPRLLLLDEPTAALDIVCKREITKYLDEFRKKGGVVIIATHDAEELKMCDSLYILKGGSLVPYCFDGNVDNLVEKLQ